MNYRISVDTGGTFTDVVVADPGGRLHIGKALTTPARAYEGLSASLDDAARALSLTRTDLLARTSLFTYGTTRATNAIVERKAAKTALLVTQGFPEILVLKEGGRFDPHKWDTDYPKPYVPRRYTFEVPERITSEGTVDVPLDEASVRTIIEQMGRDRFEAVAVCFLWSIVEPRHEQRVGELLTELLPGVPFSLSHKVNPILREYRRASATAIDASLAPIMRRHLRDLETDLRGDGYQGELLVSTSFGGVMHLDDIVERTVYMTKSGPAMAPVAGYTYAAAEGLGDSVIVCDAGGTTFDVSLVRGGDVKYTRETWLGGQFTGDCLGLSSVDVRSIGAGGGSIAWIDSGGLLRVGPHSAGSAPGPACYGRGGTEPTVTDAALVLGYIDPNYFLGGRMQLDMAAATAAVAKLAAALAKGVEETAAGIMSLAGEHMVKAIQELTVNEGHDPKRSTIVAGGGSSGFNAVEIARKLGCAHVILPRTAAALSACGAHYSNIAFEHGGSAVARTDAFDYDKVNATLSAIEAEVGRFAANAAQRGVDRSRVSFFVEARYLFQVWELEVPLAKSRFDSPADVAALEEAFHEVHERAFAVKQAGQPVECLNWKARYSGELPTLPPERVDIAGASRPEPRHSREVYFAGVGLTQAPVHLGTELPRGAVVAGPAVIEEPTTTLVVYPGSVARVSPSGSYVIDVFGDQAQAAAGGVIAAPAAISSDLDAITLAVMANRLDGIVREMSNTLLKAGRSAVINQARDFSNAIVTADNRLLSVAEGLPVHIFGAHLQAASIRQFHVPSEGDAYLHNDVYLGNTHPADHTILVPVFVDGVHLFTTSAKAHQADIGNSIPTTYFAEAKDVYQEGSLIFPCVKVQENYDDIADVIRMCRSRIRIPDQWFGDYLAGVGAARIGERRLKEFVAAYGRLAVEKFVEQWFDYSERRMSMALAKLPKGRVVNTTAHDPTPAVPDGIPVKVVVTTDPEAGRVEIDLRDNPDCLDCGLNQSEACAVNNTLTGVFNCVDWDVPKNSGSIRRIDIKLRENCVVGIPQFPHSCSMATTNLADRIINVTQSAFAEFGEGFGLAQGGNAIGAPNAVVSGLDARCGDAPYINQLFLGTNGGPASPQADGWVTYLLPCCSGLIYRDSIELDEIKHPLDIRYQRLVPDSGGAGRLRGAPGSEVMYGTKGLPMTIVVPSDGQHNPPRGVRGGHDGAAARTYKVHADGRRERMPNVAMFEIAPGEHVIGVDNGGGGYGDPLDRDVERVREDVIERWVSRAAAESVYGVVFTGDVADETLAVDREATRRRRQDLRRSIAAG
ncbi:hydantoinase B/oxoprolinase family protein [Chelatococcus reniformis]|uniref:N-methylhydantoinase A n=1 Tax=Chelatococcus reniformis TaxID=1494448 RepID=A0A916U002_9HYPH|nr:hydantoinase B/oxoprolinase family protein [Chelatococcus reniformis]GGC52847.1 N-methylhydantoinase A [Chelatococcus reniformis]